MSNMFKRIIAVVILMALFWLGFHLNQHVIGVQTIYHSGEWAAKIRELAIYAIVLSILYHLVCGKILRYPDENPYKHIVVDYIVQAVIFYVMDLIILGHFLDMQPSGLPGEGLYVAYGEEILYCIIIGFCYGLSTFVMFIFSLIREDNRKEQLKKIKD
ncbi:MAG: hypothetical protein J1E62_02585 [Lachnospiraceae bacterium]|nr:hypothetical protein [Lachnospiraceae bacterium]